MFCKFSFFGAALINFILGRAAFMCQGGLVVGRCTK